MKILAIILQSNLTISHLQWRERNLLNLAGRSRLKYNGDIRRDSSNLKENNKQTDDSSPEYFAVKKFESNVWIDDVEISGIFSSQNVTGQWLP